MQVDELAAALDGLGDELRDNLRQYLLDGTLGPADTRYVVAARLACANGDAAAVGRILKGAVEVAGDSQGARWLLVGLATSRPPLPEPALVWTSPAPDPHARETAAVLRQRIALAATSILVVGYSVTAGAETILDDLGKASARGVRVTIVADRLEGKLPLIRSRWPTGAPRPDLWTRDADEGDPMSALHAKVAVFDRQWLLVSSANLTQHGLRDNLELGVLLFGQVAGRAWDLVREWTVAQLLRSLTADW